MLQLTSEKKDNKKLTQKSEGTHQVNLVLDYNSSKT